MKKHKTMSKIHMASATCPQVLKYFGTTHQGNASSMGADSTTNSTAQIMSERQKATSRLPGMKTSLLSFSRSRFLCISIIPSKLRGRPRRRVTTAPTTDTAERIAPIHMPAALDALLRIGVVAIGITSSKDSVLDLSSSRRGTTDAHSASAMSAWDAHSASATARLSTASSLCSCPAAGTGNASRGGSDFQGRATGTPCE
mmetsp:Transcript_12781/g.37221  ORF Transcript_12781/g.37221 Transcript_12781/m.37221 type:complete len:200 (+) Transcript_12781:1845-2444(+)